MIHEVAVQIRDTCGNMNRRGGIADDVSRSALVESAAGDIQGATGELNPGNAAGLGP